MKATLKYIIALCAAPLLLTNNIWYSQNTVQKVVAKYKTQLIPFPYDGYLSEEIVPGPEEKKEIISFTAFRGVSYRLIFCVTDEGAPVTIRVYDRAAKEPNRKKVFDSSEMGDSTYYIFEPQVSRRYYIEYSVPINENGKTKKTNMVMIIGANVKRAEAIMLYTQN